MGLKDKLFNFVAPVDEDEDDDDNKTREVFSSLYIDAFNNMEV